MELTNEPVHTTDIVPAIVPEDCPVCYDSVGENGPLPCGHTLCLTCENRIKAMERWEAGSRRCPLCRHELAPIAAPAPPPVDARMEQLRTLATRINYAERQYRRQQNSLARAQRDVARTVIHANGLAQMWNNLLAGDVTGTTAPFATALIQTPTPAMMDRLQLHARNTPFVAPAAVALPAPALPAPAMRVRAARVVAVTAAPAAPAAPTITQVVHAIRATQPAAAATGNEGHKCGHRGCDHYGTAQGVAFRRMSDGRRLYRCLDHTH